MSGKITRRDAILKGTVLAGFAATGVHLIKKADGQIVWEIDGAKCINSKLGELTAEACDLCTVECVVTQSAVRAVNHHSECGRCYICPAYFKVTSAVDENGLPSEKLCPRDAIERKAIGWVDPEDPANNFYDYIIDEEKCDGCGKCVMECKEPAGLGSIRLEVRHNLCVGCNRCAISTVCPNDALSQLPATAVPEPEPAESESQT